MPNLISLSQVRIDYGFNFFVKDQKIERTTLVVDNNPKNKRGHKKIDYGFDFFVKDSKMQRTT